MTLKLYWQRLMTFWQTEPHSTNFSRAIRTAIAVFIPLALSAWGWLPANISLGIIAAQNIAALDVRGAYSLRLALLTGITIICTIAAWLGLLAGNNLAVSLFGVILVALWAGLCRHISSDYGPTAAITSALIYAISIGLPRANLHIGSYVLCTFIGGLFGVLIQLFLWPFKAQYPLRRSVAECWQGMADLFEGMLPDLQGEGTRHEDVARLEGKLRETINKTTLTLITAESSGLLRVVKPLENLNLITARLAVRVVGFNTALESLMADQNFAPLMPGFQSVLTSLANTARSVSIVTVSRQESHLTQCEVRIQRVLNLIQALESRLTSRESKSLYNEQMLNILRLIREQVETIAPALRAVVARNNERPAFSMELLELNTWTLRPLSATLNLNMRFDPALMRYTARVLVLALISVGIYRLGHFHYGYWLLMTVCILAQPDYGTTRQKTVQRIIGTLSGCLVTGLILHFTFNGAWLIGLTVVTAFCFAYFLKNNYALAVFFITLFVIFLIEANIPNPMVIAVERMLWTLLAAVLVIVSSFVFWPVWERKQFPVVMAKALRNNALYWEAITHQLQRQDKSEMNVVKIRHAADSANNNVFVSLQRLYSDPKNQQKGVELAANLANGNQRITHFLSLISLHLHPGLPAINHPELQQLLVVADNALNLLAAYLKGDTVLDKDFARAREALNLLNLPIPTREELERQPELKNLYWLFSQLGRAATEVSALLLIVKKGS